MSTPPKAPFLINRVCCTPIILPAKQFTAVATLGTALTAEHLPLLRKGEPKIFLAYDGDKVGRAAAFKASKLLSMSGFDGGVVLFEGGLDPADMIKNGQIEALNALLHRPIPFIEFVISEMISAYDLQDPKAKETALHENIAFLKTLSPLLQEEYRPFVASKLGISPSLIHIGHKKNTTAQSINFSHHDIWELSFIKTILERPQLLNSLLNYIDVSLLQYRVLMELIQSIQMERRCILNTLHLKMFLNS
jgi:DNA primase